MKHECFWKDDGYVPSPPLARSIDTDYLIVGGGVAGLFCAHFLLEAGIKRITLIEQNTVGSGSTGRSAGMLTGEIETATWVEFEKRLGAHAAGIYWHAQQAAMHVVRDLVKKENLQCEFSEAETLFLAHSSRDIELLENDARVRAAIGANHTILRGTDAADEFSPVYYTVLERLELGMSVNPLKFAHELARSLKRRGVAIYEHTALLKEKKNTAIVSGGNTISFNMIIKALGTYEHGPGMKNFLTTIGVSRPFSLAELEQFKLEDKDMFIDVSKMSYHYGKVTDDSRILVGFGDIHDDSEGQDVAVHEPHVKSIEWFFEKAFGVKDVLDYAWTGRYAMIEDIVPLVSHTGNVVRFGGAGGIVATMTVADFAIARLLGKQHAFEPLYVSASATGLSYPAAAVL